MNMRTELKKPVANQSAIYKFATAYFESQPVKSIREGVVCLLACALGCVGAPPCTAAPPPASTYLALTLATHP